VKYTCDCERASNLRLEPTAVFGSAEQFLASLTGTDLWRYQALLPASRDHGSHLHVGGTPLYDVGLIDGVNVHLKDETRNPSGSLKDRATEVALAVARAAGITEVVTASTGNAAASLACIAAAQKMQATILVPRSTPIAKLAQIRAYGAKVAVVDGSYDDACECAIKLASAKGMYCRNTGYNPFVREGKKTAAYEIAEQLQWNVPHWVAIPCGDGSILSGIAKGFEELYRLGVTTKVPKLIAAQAASSNSVGSGFDRWTPRSSPIPSPLAAVPCTIADSISVAQPRDYFAAVAALGRSNGIAVAVSDADIHSASVQLSRRFGTFVEPSSAAAWAVVERLIARGTVKPSETVVVVLTGTGLKDPLACFEAETAVDAALEPAAILSPAVGPTNAAAGAGQVAA